MTDLLARIAIGIATKLITETFLSKLLVEGMRAWAKQTQNDYDDRVVAAIAQALGVPADIIKENMPSEL